ncbi:hypothetical protein GIB67_007308 [Kingdonia uniflora]|uniref:WD repeat-containing protein 44 n=1 Tax=Kingdonia uniflora TaxID=39325 RepID=A0A7J7NX56_9MAGN|nr:hypothetical protein GIB67_007308 [Kingdonia uniflora]
MEHWDGLGEDHEFFESRDRISTAVSVDIISSDSEYEYYEDNRISFCSALSTPQDDFHHLVASSKSVSEDYNIWMAEPGSIKERRIRLLQEMGLAGDKELRPASAECRKTPRKELSSLELLDMNQEEAFPPTMISRSRSEEKIVSKKQLVRSFSAPSSLRNSSQLNTTRVNPFWKEIRQQPVDDKTSKSSGAFFLIKNLDTGKEFIVNELNEDGMWNRLRDLQTGKQLTLEEFEKCVGYSPIVKELMRRENVARAPEESIGSSERKMVNAFLSKSFRYSKRRGVGWLKNIKGVANSINGLRSDKDGDHNSSFMEQRSRKSASSGWTKVRQNGKAYKELTGLYMCQEIQAHQGSIWTIRFSLDGRYLASAGEDRIIHVWEVENSGVMSSKILDETNSGPLPPLGDAQFMTSERKRRGKLHSQGRKSGPISDYVAVPETVFSISEKPVCSFQGHLDDVLDLSWSKSQFNPVDERYFISGSLDAKVRIWSIPDRQVVDWTDLHEMVTAVCYTPDGKGALIGSHKGSCRLYNTSDLKLNQKGQIDVQNKKKSHAKKITGFQFAPGNPSEVLITSADSRIRIFDGSDVIHKFRGFRNISSQISASFTTDGKYAVCASEDSQVYIWKRDEIPNSSGGKSKGLITTRSHEHFQCRDVSIAIPWPGSIKCEQPSMLLQPQRNSKQSGPLPPHPSSSSTLSLKEALMNHNVNHPPHPPMPLSLEDGLMNHSTKLPPLPKNTSLTEEELANASRSESWIDASTSFVSASSSFKYGDSPSISTSANTSAAPSRRLFDGSNNRGNRCVSATAWGMIIVTAGLGGEIRTYQNFGLPHRHYTFSLVFMRGE